MALVIALLTAQVYWIQFHIVGMNGWVDAVKALPDFVVRAKKDVFVAAICCALGAHTAYFSTRPAKYRRNTGEMMSQGE